MIGYRLIVKRTDRRRSRGGFIFLMGVRTIIRDDALAPPVHTVCPRCNRDADMVGKSYRRWFTFFFIPVFPISAAQYFTQCSNCGGQFPVAPAQLQTRLAESDQQQSQEAISLYNSLRASPANSITLNQLMMMYGSMKEYDQAIGAAADFPQALHNSEQCMTTLARVYLAKNDLDNALKWFDAAVTRNAQLGEAHYYKAVTHLMRTPPETERAIQHARAARKAGYPNADALLKEAEGKARA
jgi:tetratricopeptide (TPR) repeat protein